MRDPMSHDHTDPPAGPVPLDHLDETHDPALRSWVESANAPDADFPIQNLPLGVFRHTGGDGRARVGVAIGDQILDVGAAARASSVGAALGEPGSEPGSDPGGELDGERRSDLTRAIAACEAPALNALLALGARPRRALRRWCSALLRAGAPGREALAAALVPMREAEMLLPAHIGDYTDFYASIHHATNVGRLFRPDNPLLPNYRYVPIGYHGRASSVVPSGTPVHRPSGQIRPPDAEQPVFAPTRLLDYECELGLVIGPGNALGAPVPIEEAEEHLAGVCLVNDWSARDIQSWEYQPLGPFLAKSFATTISPWVVTVDALAPFRAAPAPRAPSEPAPLPYLDGAANRARGALAITLEVWLASRRMREEGVPPVRLSRSSTLDLYWTAAQMLAHHTSNGCNLRPGDLLASGTVSGASRDALGCLLELTRRGAEPVALPTGETRAFLADGDEVTLRGWCERAGAARIGLGEARGIIVG